MANAVNGKNVMLYWHRTDVDPEVDVAFACSTNCSFNVSVEQKEITSYASAWFREYKNDVATWSVTCDSLNNSKMAKNLATITGTSTPEINDLNVVEPTLLSLSTIIPACSLTLTVGA